MDTIYTVLIYTGTIVAILYLLSVVRNYGRVKGSKCASVDITGVLQHGSDYVVTAGMVTIDRDRLLLSDLYLGLLSRLPATDSTADQTVAFYGYARLLNPYSPVQLYEIAQILRKLTVEQESLRKSYRVHATASALVYGFKIPTVLFTDDTVVLAYAAAHTRLHEAVSVVDLVQAYLASDELACTGQEIVRQHKRVERLELDMGVASVYFSTLFDRTAFVSIDYLYGRWLASSAVNEYNRAFYKEDINHFKRLVTMYFGVMQLSAPREYLCIDTAVCEYILQVRRYDPKRNNIKAVG